MAWITPSDLRAFTDAPIRQDLSRTYLSAAQGGFTRAASALKHAQVVNEERKTKYAIFLSHNHKDEDLVHKVRSLLTGQGVSVYVDWIDGGVPDTTSGETATSLKQQIESSQKFILLGSENALPSKWCPWELGYADKAKGTGRVAVLAVDKDQDGI